MLPGTEIGPYQIESELGTGGMGTVYLARVAGDTTVAAVGERVALKVVHAHLLDREGLERRFVREGSIGGTINHRNVVRTLDAAVYQHEGKPVRALVMEYVEGRTLRDVLDEGSPVSEELCRHVGREVARGLTAIHDAGVVHRDLKPENILLRPDRTVKIMDLGVARVVDESVRLSRTGAFVGSFLYAAPEQLDQGGRDAEGRTDLYSLGLTLFELSTGRHPFADHGPSAAVWGRIDSPPPPPSAVNPRLTAFFSELVKTLLHNLPEGRLPSARALLEALEGGETSAWWRGRSPSASPHDRGAKPRERTGRVAAIYGRDRELNELHAAFRAARDGTGRVVIVCGEGGMGKTRLVEEVVRRLEEEGEELRFLRGGHAEEARSNAAWAFLEPIRREFVPGDPEARLAGYLPGMSSAIRPLGALLRGTAAAGEDALSEEALIAALVELLKRLAEDRTMVLFVDDLQLAPPLALRIFGRVARTIRDSRMLLIGATRDRELPEEIRFTPELDHGAIVGLGRLGPGDLGRIVVDVLGSRSKARRIGFEALTRSDGNPQVAAEFARFLAEPGVLESLDGDAPRGSAAITPEEVVSVLLSRLDEDDALILSAAACCGHSFDPLLVAAAIGMPATEAAERLTRIERRHGLVHSAGSRYEFQTDAVRAAVHDDLAAATREFYHLSLARALSLRVGAERTDPGEMPGDVAYELSRHLLRGGRGHESLPYLRSALDRLEGAYEHAVALELVESALALEGGIRAEDRMWMLRRQARYLGTLSRSDEELGVLEEALEMAERLGYPSGLAEARASLGEMLLRTRRYPEALEILTSAVDLAAQQGDDNLELRARCRVAEALAALERGEEARVEYERCVTRAEILGDRPRGLAARQGLSRTLLDLNDLEAAELQVEEALPIAMDLADRAAQAVLHLYLGHIYLNSDRYEQALSCHRSSHSIAIEIGDRGLELKETFNLASTMTRLHRWEEAQAWFEATRELAREVGEGGFEATGIYSLGVLSRQRGRLDEAEESFRQALALSREFDDPFCEVKCLLDLGEVGGCRGRPAESQSWLLQAIEMSVKVFDPFWEAVAHLALAGNLLSLGRPAEALLAQQRGEEIARRSGDTEARCRADGVLASIHHHRGRLAEALTACTRTVEHIWATGHLDESLWRDRQLGGIRLALGMLEEAESGLSRSLAEARSQGHLGYEGYLLLDLARVAEARGDLAGAAVLLADAIELCRKGGEELTAIYLARGRVLAARGEMEDARSHVEKAAELARDPVRPNGLLPARALLATFDGGDPADVEALLDEFRDRLSFESEMETSFLLFKAGAGQKHLERAREMLDELLEHAPPQYLGQMLESVPLHREIVTASEAGRGSRIS